MKRFVYCLFPNVANSMSAIFLPIVSFFYHLVMIVYVSFTYKIPSVFLIYIRAFGTVINGPVIAPGMFTDPSIPPLISVCEEITSILAVFFSLIRNPSIFHHQ